MGNESFWKITPTYYSYSNMTLMSCYLQLVNKYINPAILSPKENQHHKNECSSLV